MIGERMREFWREVKKVIFFHRRFQWRALFLEIGNQFAQRFRIHYCAGKNV